MNIGSSSRGGYGVLSTYCGISSPHITVGGDTNTASVVVSVILRAATMEWWVNMVKVAGKMVMMVVFIIIMRIRCVSDCLKTKHKSPDLLPLKGAYLIRRPSLE